MAHGVFETPSGLDGPGPLWCKRAWGSRPARLAGGLAGLLFCTVVMLALLTALDARVLALLSPQSPVVVADDETLASPTRTLRTLSGADPGFWGSAWRVRVGTGLIVLGMVLVLGGLLWVMDKEAPAIPRPPEKRGEPDR